MTNFLTENGTFFSRQKWSEGLDECFLRELEFEAVREGKCLNFNDNVNFMNMLDNMQYHTDINFELSDIHRRFKLAYLRYTTWKGIMEHEGVTYDPNTYSVQASFWTWLELCESYDLASAYHKVSMERMWPELNAIFGPDDARNQATKMLLPKKPPRAFENIGLDGLPMPTIDEILASYVDEEKRTWERDQKRKKKDHVVEEYVPADLMSTIKESGRVLAPSKKVIVISPELNRGRTSANTAQGSVRARRFLSF